MKTLDFEYDAVIASTGILDNMIFFRAQLWMSKFGLVFRKSFPTDE
jgi:hypothetical protein